MHGLRAVSFRGSRRRAPQADETGITHRLRPI